jgi:hypothetical protein
MAADAGAIRAGSAFVELFADSSGLAAGLKDATAKVRAWGSAVTGVGVGLAAAGTSILAPLLHAAKASAERGRGFLELQQRVGGTVEGLSALAFAAEHSGVETGDLERGLRILGRELSGLEKLSSRSADAFAALGVDAGELIKLPLEEKVNVLADAFQRAEGTAKAQGAAFAIFGRQGPALLPLLNKGRAGIAELTDEAARMGKVVTTEGAKAGRDFSIAWSKAASSLAAPLKILGGALIPGITLLADAVTAGVRPFILFVKENRQAGVVFAALGAALVGVGTALTVFSKAAAIGRTALHVLLAPVNLLWSTLGLVLGVVSTLVPILLSPWGLLAAAIALVVHQSDAFWRSLQTLGGLFGELRGLGVELWGDIRQALEDQDFQGAIEIAGAGMKLAWVKIVEALTKTWNDFLDNTFVGRTVKKVTELDEWLKKNAPFTLRPGADVLADLLQGADVVSPEVANWIRRNLRLGLPGGPPPPPGAPPGPEEDVLGNIFGLVSDEERAARAALDAALAAQRERAGRRAAEGDVLGRLFGGVVAAAAPEELARRVSVAGQFGGAGAEQAFGAGGPLDQIEKNTRAAAEKLDRVIEELREGGFDFF